ncbi:MAG: ABC transporter substrate-binding protein [Acidisphaera sp.]|nr:ABC transporter substrate-binding protein [Acidisphaera sp.]
MNPMTSPPPAKRAGRLATMLACAFALLAALFPGLCAAQSVNDQARAALPGALRDSGVLKVATSLQWPPFDFQAANGQPDGLDIRLVRLLAAKLGLRPQFEDVKFPSIVPGVQSGRFDIGVDQIGITPERARVVDFVPYYDSGYGLLVRQGEESLDVNHLCGHTLVLTQASAQVGVAQELSGACTAAGDKPIALLYFPDSADTYLALANGRGDGFLTDRAVGVYIARGNQKLAMTSGSLAGHTLLSGIVVAKGNDALRAALRQALAGAVADGSYARLMSDFGVPEGALTVAQINAPTP